MKTTLQTTSGAEITTYQQLVSNLSYVEGSESRGNYTRIGSFLLNGENVTVYKHWSYDGNYGVYTGENCENLIAEIIPGDWYPYLNENGKQIMDEHGLYELVDAGITIDVKAVECNEN